MRHGFGSAFVCSMAMVWAACQCGPKPCANDGECPQGEICDPSGACVVGSRPDGGSDGFSDGGFSDGGFSDGGFSDGGFSDGGFSDGGFSDGGFSDGGF